MSDLGLYIAASALDANQVAMNATSQDLANVDTPYYARETTNLQALQGSTFGKAGGVQVASVSQVENTIYTSAALTADGLLSQQQAINQTLLQAQSVFPEPNGGGLQSQIATFWSNWDNVASEPTNPGARQALVTQGQLVTNTLNQSSQQLTLLQNQTFSQLQSVVAQSNNDLAQVAALNNQIVTAKASGGDANSLIDQQRLLLDNLAQSIGITYNIASNGAVTVYLGGLQLVEGNNLLQQVPPNPNVLSVGSLSSPGTGLATLTSAAALGASTSVVAGANTINVTVDGQTFAITVPPQPAQLGGYTPEGLVTAVNKGIEAAGAGQLLSATLNSAGDLVLTAADTSTGSSLVLNGATSFPPILGPVAAGGMTPVTATVSYTADPSAPLSDIPLGGQAGGLITAISHISTYLGSLNQTAFDLAQTANTQQAQGFYWASGAGSPPAANGPAAYSGNVDTSGNPLSIFADASGGTSSITAATIGVNATVAGNPFYLAASGEAPTTSSTTSLNTPITITAGVNDTIDATVNGVPYVLTIAAGVGYTAATLVAAINTAIKAANAPLAATSNTSNVISLSVTGNAAGGVGNVGGSDMTLQLTGGNALPTLSMSTIATTTQQNNGANAAAMAELSNSLTGPDATYRNFMSQMGNDVAGSSTQLNAQQSITNSADANFKALSGVSSDEETVAMTTYQHAYEAAAKVVTTIETMYQSLLDAVA